jgi:hypothetical protein
LVERSCLSLSLVSTLALNSKVAMFKETVAEYSTAHPNSIEISDPRELWPTGLEM